MHSNVLSGTKLQDFCETCIFPDCERRLSNSYFIRCPADPDVPVYGNPNTLQRPQSAPSVTHKIGQGADMIQEVL